MHRVVVLFLTVLVILFAMNATAENLTVDDFLYDGNISWRSSYTDIVNVYGEPSLVEMQDTVFEHDYKVTYNDIKVCGCTGFALYLYFDNDQHLKKIEVWHIYLFGKEYNDGLTVSEINNKVLEGLKYKYGDPGEIEKITDQAISRYWNSDDMMIWLYYDNDMITEIQYNLKNEIQDFPAFSDIVISTQGL